jgi:hypothetical protein
MLELEKKILIIELRNYFNAFKSMAELNRYFSLINTIINKNLAIGNDKLFLTGSPKYDKVRGYVKSGIYFDHPSMTMKTDRENGSNGNRYSQIKRPYRGIT